MARKSSGEDVKKGAPPWMVTYGDMMTLLLTFFVLLLSFSVIEATRFKAAIASIQEGLGIWPDGSGILPTIVMRDKTQQAQETALTVDEIAEALEDLGVIESVEIYHTPSGVRLIISEPSLFASGRAEILPVFRAILRTISDVIGDREFMDIRVEGHTDNVPINTPEFPSNWDLSAGRALAVTKFLAFQGGLDPAKLSAVGYGEYRPRATNRTPTGRARNRRVEIFLEMLEGSGEL